MIFSDLYNRIFKSQAATGTSADPEQPVPSVDVARRLLERLQCSVEMHDENESHLLEYDFQGGRFSLRTWPNQNFAHLVYPFCFCTDVRHRDAIRSVVNKINMESLLTRVVMTHSVEDHRINCHVMVTLHLTSDDEQQLKLLRDAMVACFQTRIDIDHLFHEAVKLKDPEEAEADNGRDWFLIHEQEWIHTPDSKRVSSDKRTSLTLRNILYNLYDWQNIDSIKADIVIDHQLESIDNAVDYDILSHMVSDDGKVLNTDVTLLLKANLSSGRAIDNAYEISQQLAHNVVVGLVVEHHDEKATYVRVNVSHTPLEPGGPRLWQHPERRPSTVSFMVARDWIDTDTRNQEYRFFLSELKDKINSEGLESLSNIQRLVAITENRKHFSGYNLYWGRYLARCARYLEAIPYLENVFFEYRAFSYAHKPKDQKVFIEAMYLLGLCHARLQQWQKAFYYLDSVSQVKDIRITVEYVNSLVNSGDHRAEGIINMIMQDVQSQLDAVDTVDEEDASETDVDAITEFGTFLNRRRIYLLIEQKRYDEAQEMLDKILGDEEQREFALNEMAFIETQRNTKLR